MDQLRRVLSDIHSSHLVQLERDEDEVLLGKGREQTLPNFTMSSNQRKEAIHMNSMVLEKDYMQVNTPFPPSTNHVKQHTQEVEKSNFGKGQGRRHKNSTMSSSQEMGAIQKNIIFEKEYMQVDTPFPPYTNEVKQCPKEVETRSSNPIKVKKKVLGSNKCKEVASLEAGKKLKVAFYNNRTAQTDSNLFSRHLGKIIRDCNMCPLGVSSWNDIKQQKLDRIWTAIADKLESDDINDHRDHIFGWMNEVWNKWRGYLHATYVKNKPIVQALKNIPKGVDKKEWEWLVKEHFFSKSFQLCPVI
ncbi:uncharacterized protein LOC129896154 [Solanum dulcamara]|uniref:uncharacterized protein LOC129896154 n=1 Tax=Solanum dulcamara TaxID=45834 RepID=UPI0024858F17|nr:uncharacterized protein LOC129896154 [Solanum dulcamara]